jgi:hypothetical protein
VFLDDSDQASALAYHDLTDEGLPISKVFVKTILADNGSVSVGATHEICEMAVDPWLNSAYQDLQGTFWAGEVCDPVEDPQYGYEIGGVLVTDFVTPNWFGHRNAMGDIDYRKQAHAPFEVLTGGYAQKWDPQQGWQQITGARAQKAKRAKAQVGSRRERRARRWKGWQPSRRFRIRDAGGVLNWGTPPPIEGRRPRRTRVRDRPRQGLSQDLCEFAANSPAAAVSLNHSDARDGMNLIPLRMEGVLHIGPDDAHVRTHRRQLDVVGVTLARGMSVRLSRRKSTDDFEYQVPALSAQVASIQEILKPWIHA